MSEWDTHAIPPQPPNPYDLERRIALLEQSTQTIKDELGKINSNISKLVWIVMAAVILAALNLLFQQGLVGTAVASVVGA